MPQSIRLILFSFLFLALRPCLAQPAVDSPQPLTGTHSLGDSLLLLQRYGIAQELLLQASQAYREARQWPGYLATQNSLAHAAWGMEQLTQAQEHLNTLAPALDTLPATHAQRLYHNYNQGMVQHNQGNYKAAKESWAQGLQAPLPADSAQVNQWTYRGHLHRAMGRQLLSEDHIDSARRHLNSAMACYSQALPPAHPYLGRTQRALGYHFMQRGSYSLALDYFTNAHTMATTYLGSEDNPDAALAATGQAQVFLNRGEYQIASEYFTHSQVLLATFYENQRPLATGPNLIGLANIAKNQGEYAEALRLFNEALTLATNTVGPQHPTALQAYLGLGNTHMFQENFVEALKYYNTVVDINYNLLGEYHSLTATAYNNVASVYYYNGEFANALGYYRRALAISQQLYGNEHPAVANTLYNIGRVQAEQGQYEAALKNVQEAINASVLEFDDKNIYHNPNLVNFFEANDLLLYLRFKAEVMEEGFVESANFRGLLTSVETFQLSDSLINKIRWSHISERDQITLGRTAAQVYASAVRASHTLYELTGRAIENPSLVPREPGMTPVVVNDSVQKALVDKFFYFNEKNKGAVLATALAEAKAKTFGGIPDSLTTYEDSLKQRIAELTQEIIAEPDSNLTVYYREQLFKVNRSYEQLITQLEEQFPRYYQLKYSLGVVTLDSVQAFLPDSTTMLSYFLAEDWVYTMVIGPQYVSLHKQPRPQAFSQWINLMRRGITYEFGGMYSTAAHRLYNLLIPPDIPESTRHLIIIPDGEMATIPFEALLSDPIDQELIEDEAWNALPYLIKRYAVSYAFSANLMHQTFRSPYPETKAPPTGTLLALAPVFDAFSSALPSPGSQPFAPLPATVAEVDTITARFTRQQQPTLKLLRQQASEQLIKQGALANFSHVHVATHGLVNEDHPELSAILLAPDSAGVEDAVLYSGEIYNINLNAQLLTLSACETGLGKISVGEGVIGLTRALRYAGAQNIMVSLWQVADLSTSQLMIDFYTNLLAGGLPQNLDFTYAGHLRQAKLAMITNQTHASPYYWSPFILIGR